MLNHPSFKISLLLSLAGLRCAQLNQGEQLLALPQLQISPSARITEAGPREAVDAGNILSHLVDRPSMVRKTFLPVTL